MRTRSDAGFTLLELLLAITLLSMITGTILGGLHIGKRAWETGRVYETVSEVEEAARAIADQLARAYPVTLARPDGPPMMAFQGLSNSCRFVGLSEGDMQWGGLVLTEIASAPAPQGADIAIWTRVFRADDGFAPSRADMRETQALRGVEIFDISYFGVIDDKHPPVWSDSWKDRQTLPKLLSVRIGARRFGRVIDASHTVALRQQ
jgi:general secretion pathway protein J